MTKDNQLDKSTYDSAKAYLKAALEQMIAAGRSAKEFGDFALEKFGDTFIPYLHEFSQDVSKGRIKIEGLGKSAKTAIFGRHVTLEEREQLIREAAYLRAEQRGFVGGSPDEDWRMAQQEVDQRLAQETGLVEKGRKVLTSATTVIENEFDDIKHVVAGWVEGKPAAGGKKKKVVKKKKAAASKSSAAKIGAVPAKKKTEKAGKKEEPKKTTKVKKPAKKKTAGKKAAKKESAKSE